MEDAVFVVPIFDKWLVYAPLHHVTALVNSAMVAALKNGNSPPGSDTLTELYKSLENGPVDMPSPPTGPICPEFIGLIPTRACNMACIYCGFGASEFGPEIMDLSLAVQAVDWMVGHVCSIGRSTFEVHFFGGEPFFAPDVVDVIVHRARLLAARSGLIPRFEAATNGAFDEDRCRFIGDYIDTVVLSLDGPKEIHNLHRPMKIGDGSYPIVARNASSLSKSPAELCIRACVTQDIVKNLYQISRWFCETFSPSTITFEPLQPTPQSEASGLQPPDPWEFASMYVRASFLISSLGITPIYSAASIDVLRHSFCPVGRDSLIISPNGRISACYLLEREWKDRSLDLNLGHIQNEYELEPNSH